MFIAEKIFSQTKKESYFEQELVYNVDSFVVINYVGVEAQVEET